MFEPVDNSHNALQAAINAACNAGGGTSNPVNLRGWTFVLERQLWIPELTGSNPCGQNEATRLIVENGTLIGADTSAFTPHPGQRQWVALTLNFTTLRDIVLDGPVGPTLPQTMPPGCTFQVTPAVQARCITGILIGGNSHRLERVQVSEQWGYGIHATNSASNGVISASTVTRNLISGIALDNAYNWQVTGSTSTGNGENGIDISRGASQPTVHLVENSTFSNNGLYEVAGDQQGILVQGASQNTIRGNHVNGNKVGILVFDASNNRIEQNNVVFQNLHAGIQVGAADPTVDITTSGTVVSGNRVYSNGKAGIQVGAPQHAQGGRSFLVSTTIAGNTIDSNAVGNGAQYQIEFHGEHNGTSVSSNRVNRPGACYPTSTPSQVTYLGNTCEYIVQAEAYSSMSGVCPDSGAVGCLDSGDWIRYSAVDFGQLGARSVTFRIGVDPCCAGKTVEVRLGSISGQLIGILMPTSTGGWWSFQDQTINVSFTTGVHDLYFVFQGGYGAGNIDSFTLSSASFARNPYIGMEAESFDAMNGVCVNGGAVGCLESGDWVKYGTVDLGSGASSVTFRIGVDPCCSGGGRQVQVRVGSAFGPVIGTLSPAATGGWFTFTEQTATVSSNYTGIQDIYLFFDGGFGIGNIDKLTFGPPR